MKNTHGRHSTHHPVDERVASLLHAAAAPTEPGPQPGEDEAVAAFRASHERPRRSSTLSSLTSAKVAAAAALSVGVLATGGAAVAGTLPGAAQDTARDVLAELGIDVPGSHDDRAEPATTPRGSGEAEPREVGDTGNGPERNTREHNGPEHGQTISELATSTELRGAEKGAAIAELASGGKSRASENRAGERKPAEQRSRGGADSRQSGAPSERSGRGAVEGTPPVKAPPVQTPPVETRDEGAVAEDAPPVETPNDGAVAEEAPPVQTPSGGREAGDRAGEDRPTGGTEQGAGRP